MVFVYRAGLLILAVAPLGVSGCASIISGRSVEVPINTTPSAAHVTVSNDQGELVAQAQTPAVVTLKRGRGFLRKPPRYLATIEKQGHQTHEVEINPTVNPWVAGNIALGGVIGLVADSATGAMWRMSPGEIDCTLAPQDGALAAAESGSIQQASHAESGE